jgi:hypothetical protein
MQPGAHDELDGTSGWRAGVEASIRCVRSRQRTARALQCNASYMQALTETLIFLEDMLERGVEKSVCTLDGVR